MVFLKVNMQDKSNLWVQVFDSETGEEIIELNQYGYKKLENLFEEVSDWIVIEHGLSIGTIEFKK